MNLVGIHFIDFANLRKIYWKKTNKIEGSLEPDQRGLAGQTKAFTELPLCDCLGNMLMCYLIPQETAQWLILANSFISNYQVIISLRVFFQTWLLIVVQRI